MNTFARRYGFGVLAAGEDQSLYDAGRAAIARVQALSNYEALYSGNTDFFNVLNNLRNTLDRIADPNDTLTIATVAAEIQSYISYLNGVAAPVTTTTGGDTTGGGVDTSGGGGATATGDGSGAVVTTTGGGSWLDGVEDSISGVFDSLSEKTGLSKTVLGVGAVGLGIAAIYIFGDSGPKRRR